MRTILIKVRAIVALFGLGLAFALMAPPTAQAAAEMTATENVNVRAEPNETADVVGGLLRSETVSVISTADGWTKINFEKGIGYVASSYLSEAGDLSKKSDLTEKSDLPVTSTVDAGTTKITTASLNLRKGAGVSYPVIKVLAKGTRVTLTGKTASGFSEIVNGTATGWASSQYLATAPSGLPAIIGTRVATAALDIRTTSGADAKTVAEVKKGTVLSVTGVTQNGRAQIVYKKAVRWVTAKYLATPSSNLPAPPKLPKIAAYRYATVALNIRSTYKDDYKLLTEVPTGTKLAVTSVVKQGRRQIVFENAVRWVTNKYLSKTKPKAPAGDTKKYAVEKGLKPNAIKVHRAILKEYPEITVFGGKRPDPIPDHPSGRALDCMIPNYKSKHGKALGLSMSRWARANAATLGINYIIWDQHIWNNERSSEGWRYMAGRGSDSANHKNHVHITVYAKGYSPA